jgi:O-antigen/teichoic acid export membrane protein
MLFEKLLRNRSDFIRNALKLVSGTALAQGISLLIAPLITRLYSPADFGIFTFLISLAGAFGLIGTLRYEMAIILPKDEREAINVALLSLRVAIGISLLLFASAIFFNITGFYFQSMESGILHGLFLLPLLVLMIALTNILQNWYNRNNQYKTIALSRIFNSAGNNLMTLILGFIGFGMWGLLTGNFFGQLMMLALMVIGLSTSFRGLIKHYNADFQRDLARKYRDLPLANTPQVLIELVQVFGIVFLLKIFSDENTLGWYALSQRLLQAPLWLVGAALCQVFYKDASAKFAVDGDIKPVLSKTIRLAFFSALPVLIILLFFGPWLISTVFGTAWYESGVIARILAPWFFLDFIRYSISQTPLILGKTRQMLIISILGAAGIVTGITCGSIFSSIPNSGFVFLSAIMSVYALSVIIWNIRIVSNAAGDPIQKR